MGLLAQCHLSALCPLIVQDLLLSAGHILLEICHGTFLLFIKCFFLFFGVFCVCPLFFVTPPPLLAAVPVTHARMQMARP